MDGFFDNSAVAHGPVGNRQTTLAQNERCCGFNSHLGQFQESGVRNQESGVRSQESGVRIRRALADQSGVVATLSRWRAWVRIASRVLGVGWTSASLSGCNPPPLCWLGSD